MPLAAGLNELSLVIHEDPAAVGSRVTLKVEEAGGTVVHRFDLELVTAEPVGILIIFL